MKTGKIVAALMGMFILGGLGFWALGALVELRIGQPVAQEFQLSPINSSSQALQRGLEQVLKSAQTALAGGSQTDAARTLDAAKRAAEVARDSMGGPFADVFDSVKRARFALQNGDKASAARVLSRAERELAEARAPAHETILLKHDQDIRGYKGATVLNATGVRIGEVKRVNGSILELVIGAHRDVLGFIDFAGGKVITVPANAVTFGKQKALGSTMIVLPIFVSSEKKFARKTSSF